MPSHVCSNGGGAGSLGNNLLLCAALLLPLWLPESEAAIDVTCASLIMPIEARSGDNWQ
eukprot:SAG31_NODE_24575_length_478_cov_1.614776_1_plen_58_part_10